MRDLVDKLQAMRWYVRVCDTGSFTAAAKVFGVSTASVSRAVSFLEEDIQTQLMQRSTRRCSLTDVGSRFLESCRDIIHKVDAATALAVSYAHRPAGCLRVHSITEFGLEFLLPLIIGFNDRHPEISIDLTLTRERPHLIDEGLDILITMSSKLPDSELIARRIGSFSSILCASPDYLKSAGIPLAPKDLKNHRCIGLADDLYPNGWQFSDGSTETTISIQTTFRANMSDAVMTLSAKGYGICLIPDFVAASALQNGSLVRVLPRYKLHTRDIFAVYSPRRYPDPKLKSWIEHLREGIPSLMKARSAIADNPEFWVGR
jgi:DNA-binding transcriptional LysR family regulator